MRTGRMSDVSDLPVVILAGGRGSRLMEETATIPKPMLMVGDKPLLQHVMDIYLQQGVWEFIVPVGYKQEQVYGYFISQKPHTTVSGYYYSFYFDTHVVRVVDTGLDTQTGGRLLQLKHLLGKYEKFFFTYGDGVGNVNLDELLDHHSKDTLITLTAVHPAGRFGRITFESLPPGPVYSTKVVRFGEKEESWSDWVNGGFAVLSTQILRGIDGDHTNLEKDIFPVVARHGFMRAYRHEGFWRCVDTLRDLEELRQIYKESTPWLPS